MGGVIEFCSLGPWLIRPASRYSEHSSGPGHPPEQILKIRDAKHEFVLDSGPPRVLTGDSWKEARMATTVKQVPMPVSKGAPSTETGLVALQNQSPNDVVITLAIRSPLCKARKGGFKDTRCVTMVSRQF